MACEGIPDTFDLELISKDRPFLSMQLLSAVTRDALAGTLEPAPSDSK